MNRRGFLEGAGALALGGIATRIGHAAQPRIPAADRPSPSLDATDAAERSAHNLLSAFDAQGVHRTGTDVIGRLANGCAPKRSGPAEADGSATEVAAVSGQETPKPQDPAGEKISASA